MHGDCALAALESSENRLAITVQRRPCRHNVVGELISRHVVKQDGVGSLNGAIASGLFGVRVAAMIDIPTVQAFKQMGKGLLFERVAA